DPDRARLRHRALDADRRAGDRRRGDDAAELPRPEALVVPRLRRAAVLIAVSALLVTALMVAPGAEAKRVGDGPLVRLARASKKLTKETHKLSAALAPSATQSISQYTTTPTLANPNTPVLITDKTTPPQGYRLDANQVLAIARKAPKVISEIAKRHAQH